MDAYVAGVMPGWTCVQYGLLSCLKNIYASLQYVQVKVHMTECTHTN